MTSRIVALVVFVAALIWDIVVGSLRVLLSTVAPGWGTRPSIVAYPMESVSDLELVTFQAAITIVPGSVVVGIAAASDEEPATVYVHSLYGTREQVVAELARSERLVLRMTRGRAYRPRVEEQAR